ncbi:hypothetical protein FOA43_001370 [Brettanomyces nanus]|uniref:Uncharacterized protein n=1 Tax=Eeniella nana TaxID=13502 RepID=A0A875RNQ8_EENNA|nr:uncharacterized protein FOA43_001370 [Brettanomyces nanus]QPG74050.1 hypothetical protein FOA43_001370 [Brettanomyces nanus]
MSTLQAFYPPIESDSSTSVETTSVTLNAIVETSTPSILSLPINNPATFISVYESCLKPLYTLNIALLDKLHNRSNYSLLLIHMHQRFISLFRELNDFKKMVSLTHASNFSDSLSNSCFVRSLLSGFDLKFRHFIDDLHSINSQIFSNAEYWALSPLATIYQKIISRSDNGEIFVLKETDKLECLRLDVLVHSDSLKSYKKFGGQFDAKAIVNEDLANFHNELSKCFKSDGFAPQSHSHSKLFKPSPDDYKIATSSQFKQFNARRLQLLGLFDKRIF